MDITSSGLEYVDLFKEMPKIDPKGGYFTDLGFFKDCTFPVNGDTASVT